MTIFILWIRKVRQRGHLICPRTAGKQQGQRWNRAGWLQNLPSSLPPFERDSSKSCWTADLRHLFPWSDQPLQRIRISHIQHSTSVAMPTRLLAHLYLPLWIKPISQKKKKNNGNNVEKRNHQRQNKQSDGSLTSSGWPWAFDGSQSAALELHS